MEAMISKADYDELEGKYNALRHELEQLKRLIFSAKSERFVPTESAPEQLNLGFELQSSKAEVEEQTEQITCQRKKRKAHPGRTPLPDHLPVRREVIEPQEDTTGMKKIGEEITRKVDYTPGTLEIVEYVRPKYARPEAEQTQEKPAIVIADVPDQVLPKAIAGAGLLTHILVAKYIDHLPFYRLIEGFKRDYSWAIHKSTINDWFAATCTLLEPLYEVLKRNVLETDYLQGDESRLKVLDRLKKKNTHLGYMWVFHNPVSKGVLFTYRKGRGTNVLNETLDNFTGLLQSDGYSAYTKYARGRQVKLVSCLAHIRRKFFEAKKNHPELAQDALKAIQYLYRVERVCKGRNYSTEQRQQIRQRIARPAYEAFLQWVNYQHKNNLSKGAIGKALKYAADHLPRLKHYLDDARIEIDNNLIENKIRPLALGRKNYLFAGSHPAAQRAAMMYSFFASCKAANVNPRTWLHDVLLRIQDHKVNQIERLLPANWSNEQTADT